mgnify:CR=1 FL=1
MNQKHQQHHGVLYLYYIILKKTKKQKTKKQLIYIMNIKPALSRASARFLSFSVTLFLGSFPKACNLSLSVPDSGEKESVF